MLLATLIDGQALLNVALFGLLLGAGVPVAFGLFLLGLDRRGAGGAATVGWTALAGVAGLACLAAVALGLASIA